MKWGRTTRKMFMKNTTDLSSVWPKEWTGSLQSWVIPVFSLDLLLIAAADSDGLRLRPSDGLPLRLSGGSLTEAKLFDFSPGRDQVTPCRPLGRQGIQIKSGQCRVSDSKHCKEHMTDCTTAQFWQFPQHSKWSKKQLNNLSWICYWSLVSYFPEKYTNLHRPTSTFW